MSALLKSFPEKFILEIVEGPDKGAQFQVLPGDIRIGRGEDNDIVLNDPRCSREQAVLKINSQNIMIENKSQNSSLTVDGQSGQRAFVSNNSKISMGNTVFIFKRVSNQVQESNKSKLTSFEGGRTPTTNNSSNNKFKFYLIVGVIGLFAAYLFTSSKKSTGNNELILSIDEEIELSKKRQEDLLREQSTKGKNSRQYLDAQASFMKGLRDYREGIYKSAMVSFSTALAIYPEHPTARRYYDLSKLKLDEQIQFLLQEGNRYMAQNKYKLAMASFKNVMLLIGDSKNKFFEEAKTKYNESYLLLKGSF